MSGELEIRAEALPAFERNGLMCYRRVVVPGKHPVIAWVAGNDRGCITFQAMTMPRTPVVYGSVMINGVPWMGTDISRHTPRPVTDYDEKPSAEPCIFLDGIRCYCDGSSLQAMELLKRVVKTGSEDVIWNELAANFRVWIGG